MQVYNIQWVDLNITTNEEEEEAGKGFESDEQRRAFFGLMKSHSGGKRSKGSGDEKSKDKTPKRGESAMSKGKKPEWVQGMKYHMALGFEDKGTHSWEATSKDGRWHVRRGNFSTMILTDKKNDKVHVVKGKMPEVDKFITEME